MKTISSLLLTGLLAITSTSYATSINDRQEQQKSRISQGIRSGELTKGEAHRLAHQQRSIAKQEARFKSDGNFTRKERAVVQHRLNHSSAKIYGKKHNRADRN